MYGRCTASIRNSATGFWPKVGTAALVMSVVAAANILGLAVTLLLPGHSQTL